jgi:hypothetical protein
LPGVSGVIAPLSMSTPRYWRSDGKYIYVSTAKYRGGPGTMHLGRLPAGGGTVQPGLTLPLSSQSVCESARDGRCAWT